MQRYEEMRQAKISAANKEKPEDESDLAAQKVTTIFHGTRTDEPFTKPPGYLQNKEHDNFIPKKWIHTFVGHSKGVQRVRFFPKYGHLMLSASHDGTAKIWDVLTHRKCI